MGLKIVMTHVPILKVSHLFCTRVHKKWLTFLPSHLQFHCVRRFVNYCVLIMSLIHGYSEGPNIYLMILTWPFSGSLTLFDHLNMVPKPLFFPLKVGWKELNSSPNYYPISYFWNFHNRLFVMGDWVISHG